MLMKFTFQMNKIMETCKELIRENNDLKNNERVIKTKYSILKKELDDSIKKYLQKNKVKDGNVISNVGIYKKI